MRGVAPGALAFLCLVAACGPGVERHMPLREGTAWTYTVQRDFDKLVAEARVEGRVPVGGTLGWRIVGPGLDSTLAWSDGRLVAGSLAGTRFDPPVPLFAGGEAAWSGSMSPPGRTEHAQGTLTQAEDTLRVGGRDAKSVRTVLTLRGATGETVVETWFVAGTGIVRQESRRGGRLLTRTEYVSGP